MRVHAEIETGGAERRTLSESVAGGRVPRRPVVQTDRVPGAGADQKDGGGGQRGSAAVRCVVVHPRRFAERADPSELAVRPDRRHRRLHLY